MASPSFIAGILFAISWTLLIDGICIANQDADERQHFHFVLAIPAIFSTLAFFLMNITSPQELFPDTQPKAKALFLLSWVMLFSASLAALTIVGTGFVGDVVRERTWPGVAIVLHSSLMPLAAAALWSAKQAAGERLVLD